MVHTTRIKVDEMASSPPVLNKQHALPETNVAPENG